MINFVVAENMLVFSQLSVIFTVLDSSLFFVVFVKVLQLIIISFHFLLKTRIQFY